MLEVIVQSTDRPRYDFATSSKVQGYPCLMDCPGAFHASRVFARHREFRLFHAMWQLKHDTYRDTEHQDAHTVVKENDPGGWNSSGIKNAQPKKTILPVTKFTRSHPVGRGIHAPDPTANNPFEIINKLHLGCYHPVERPEIKMLHR